MVAVVDPTRLVPSVTPQGHLVLVPDPEAPPLAPRIASAFERGAGHGLLWLGGAELGTKLTPALAYWRDLGARFVAAVCLHPAGEPPPPEELDTIARAAPPMRGVEYVDAAVLARLWDETADALRVERGEVELDVAEYLKTLDPRWNVVGRVHFNLAENRDDDEAPFAFLATYTGKLSARGAALHRPLGDAMRAMKKEQLLSLLVPVQRAAERCAWVHDLVESGEVFHPLRFTADEAMQFLADLPALEQAGVIVRMPAAWKTGRPPRPKVSGTVGGKPPAGLGAAAVLDFEMGVTLDGERLTREEIEAILESTHGLALLRGRWVEVDGAQLRATLDRFERAQRLAEAGALTFADAMRMLVEMEGDGDAAAVGEAKAWSRVQAGEWLAEILRGLRSPEGLAQVDPGPALRGTLRPYQQVGVRWLHLLSQLGLGACLADDMGLGKTIQVLALLLLERPRTPNLLVAPASLLANWANELARFAPELRAVVAHPSFTREEIDPKAHDLVITSYGSLLRAPWVEQTTWNLVILDEAQAIKNGGAKQTRAAKRLSARARIALTGTPVENKVGDLWSIFDFLNPGLLGSAKELTRWLKEQDSYAPLRELVRPYILRRLKTDRAVIADLPEKIEVKAYCALSRKQAVLYQQAVAELQKQLQSKSGMQRKGAVLASLMRLKQICNHPSHWLGDGAWHEGDSGKWARLRELAEVIAAKQEKVLVFTQFREMTAPLAAFLAEVFGREGLVLHGETAVGKRQQLVKRFQDDEQLPFFVLSLKAGGTGLNLTAASHVVHFDRWWNPAVEDQATDRAFRIGQTRNVLVHKLVCRGTVEEKIDEMLGAKQKLSRELLEGGGEINLTELSDEELMKIVALDLGRARGDA